MHVPLGSTVTLAASIFSIYMLGITGMRGANAGSARRGDEPLVFRLLQGFSRVRSNLTGRVGSGRVT